MQKITVLGNVGSSRLNTLPDGKAVLNFGLAAHRRKGEDEITTWYECSVWGERAEKLAPHISEGVTLLVEGLPSVDAYISKDTNEPRASLRVLVDDLYFAGGRKKDPPAA